MGIFSDLKDFCDEVEVPAINVYDPDYIAEKIRVLKSDPCRNRFRLCDGKKRFAVRVTGLDEVTHDVKNVMDCYLCGELCMNRHPQFYTKPIKSHNYIIFEDEAVIRSDFARIADLRSEILNAFPTLADDFTELSIGMSDDYPIAIEYGSTMVRIGSMIFGSRV
mgnify:CR=1 FL=1